MGAYIDVRNIHLVSASDEGLLEVHTAVESPIERESIEYCYMLPLKKRNCRESNERFETERSIKLEIIRPESKLHRHHATSYLALLAS